MTIRKEDWPLINKAISDAVAPLRPSGWRKALFELRQWGVLAATATVIVALLAVAAGAIYQAVARVDREARFETNTENRLRTIEAQLLDLRAAQSPGAVLKDLNRADRATFTEALPALRKISEQPVSTVKPDPATLREVIYKLRTVDESTPDYWPTVLRFIEFASAGMSPDVPPPGKPTSMAIGNIGEGVSLSLSHEVVLLDGGALEESRFTNCRIMFTEHPVKMRNVAFINCVFEMPVSATPTPYLKHAAQELLVADLRSVLIPSL
jgi:hypothetical protein